MTFNFESSRLKPSRLKSFRFGCPLGLNNLELDDNMCIYRYRITRRYCFISSNLFLFKLIKILSNENLQFYLIYKIKLLFFKKDNTSEFHSYMIRNSQVTIIVADCSTGMIGP